MIVDTSIAIDRFKKKKEEIHENITIITAIYIKL